MFKYSSIHSCIPLFLHRTFIYIIINNLYGFQCKKKKIHYICRLSKSVIDLIVQKYNLQLKQRNHSCHQYQSNKNAIFRYHYRRYEVIDSVTLKKENLFIYMFIYRQNSPGKVTSVMVTDIISSTCEFYSVLVYNDYDIINCYNKHILNQETFWCV